MKNKILLIGTLVLGGLLRHQDVNAACQTLTFSNGNSFCFDINRINNDTFEAQISSARLDGNSGLSCSLSLPNGSLVQLPGCQGRFNYPGTSMKIELRADTANSYAILVANYDFGNGKFYDGSTSNTTPNYQNYQVELHNPSTVGPATHQWIDITLKVRNNGSSSYTSSFAGKINLSVEEYRNGRWESAKSSDYELERTSYTFSQSENGEKRLNSILKLKTQGEFRLIAKIDGSDYSTYQSFNAHTRNNQSSSSSNTSYISIESISTNFPSINQWIDVGLRLDGHSSEQRASFRVEENRNGRWEAAYSSDYELDRTQYRFASSENYRTLGSLLRLKNRGEFRLVVELDNGNRDYRTLNVEQNSSSNNSYNDGGYFSIYSFSPSHPANYEWVSITIKAYDRQGNLNTNANNAFMLTVEKLEGNQWRTASYRDYDLNTSSLRFSYTDRGIKTLNNSIRFRTNGTYRIKAIDTNSSAINGSREITIGNIRNDTTVSNNHFFSDKEYSKIRAIYQIRPGVINALKKDYIKLRNSSLWQITSDEFYANMKATVDSKNNSGFSSWNAFYQGFENWFSLTVRTR